MNFQVKIKNLIQLLGELWKKFLRSIHSHIKDYLAESKEKTEITEDEEAIYAEAFKKTLNDLANEVYGIHEPYDIAQRVLRTACDFYDADWCGMFDVDMMLDLWMPFWWYNKLTGGMTQTQLKEGQVMGSFDMFRQMIADNTSHYQPDVESIRNDRPEEYALFSSQDVKSFMALPYSRREQGIIFLRNPKRFVGCQEMLRIVSNILIQEINEQKHLDRMKLMATHDHTKENANITVNLFGSLEIITEQCKLSESDIKSPLCSRIFVLLMLNRHRHMTSRELSEILWPDRDCDDPTGNLRSNLYRLRSVFRLATEQEIVVTTPNGYRINPELKVHTDYGQFETLCGSIRPFMSSHDKIKVLKHAVTIYDGKLFPNGDGEHWQIAHSAKYHMMYLDIIEKLMKLLNETGDYKTLQEYSMKAIKIEPDSTVIIYWLVVALRKNGAIEMAKKHLESARARLLEEEFKELEYRLKISV